MPNLEAAARDIEATYRRRTTRSAAHFQRALQSLPGGDTRSALHYDPYPTFMAAGAGCRLTDVDGNEYLDFLSNYTSLVHGHANPHILAAIQEQLSRGTAHGAPIELQVALAEALRSRVPSVELIRFANSGTEAVLNAIRAARAFTGRSKILKMEGGYHGTYDAAEVSVDPGLDPPAWPKGRPDGPGLSPGLTGEVLIAPFNDPDQASEIIGRHGTELAAVIVEPVMGAGGMIPADREFLERLRASTSQHDVLLIFDEVVSFRLARGGAQEIHGLRPDLTTFGKVIGGGLPVGAFGGRADVMAHFDPRVDGHIPQSGTFNGNAATLAAGLASLELLTSDAIQHINALGTTFRVGLERVADELGVPLCITGIGSLAQIHLGHGPIHDYRSAVRARHPAMRWLHLALLNRGVFIAPRGMCLVSTVMVPADVEAMVGAFGAALEQVQPLLAASALTGAAW